MLILIDVDVPMTSNNRQSFQEIENIFLKMKKKYLSCLNVCFISSYQRTVIGLVTFRLTLVLSSSFVEIQKSKRADQDGCHFTIMTLLPRDITPLLLVANIKEAYSF